MASPKHGPRRSYLARGDHHHFRITTIVTAAAITLAAPGLASAAPHPTGDQLPPKPTTSAQANAQIDQLGQQLEVVTENYDNAVIELAKRRHAANQAKDELAADNARVASLKRQVQQIAVSSYQNGGQLTSFSSLVTSTSPQDFLDRLGTLDYISSQQQATVAALEDSTKAATTARDSAEAAVAAEAKTATGLRSKRTWIQSHVAMLQAERARLTAAEKAARAAAAARARAAAAAAARQAAADARAAADRATAERAARASAAQAAAEAAATATTAAPSSAAPTTNPPTTQPPTTQPPTTQPPTTQPPTTQPPTTQPPTTQPPTTQPPTTQPPTPAPPPAPPASGRAAQAVATAIAQIGKPYVWAAAGPDAFDCSGLTMYSWAAAGVSLPHSSSGQYSMGTHVGRNDLQPGDLVFYYSPIHHVAIYVGHGMVVHAPTEGENVQYAPVFSMPYVGATRVG